MNDLQKITLAKDWSILLSKLEEGFGKKLNMNAILFLIGVQELGKGSGRFSKEQKQDLMHIAICKILSHSGYYRLEGIDEDGWPHWILRKKLPFLDILAQEDFLKIHVIRYFRNELRFI